MNGDFKINFKNFNINMDVMNISRKAAFLRPVLHLYIIMFLCPPSKKEGHIVLHMSVGRSVGMSVGRYVGSP